ncbi:MULTISPECIES: hypothetical protein [Halomonadaceae]|uniref:hypothetical protein n=1 Tax=Halomonadaceae TaxID=28256 RepID=UPI00158414C2|nr:MULTISPECIES: hypothetical protein [Halomonas]MDI4636720.1 hypothetical protein [Halomonas sp. BMC7]NUJ61085.1 hypothetical protein [Halomonas taeanensis]
MRPSSHLNKSYNKFLKKSNRLRDDVVKAQSLSFRERDLVLGYTVLQFHNLWAAYCRTIALSAYYKANSSSGKTSFSVPASARTNCRDLESYIYDFTILCKPFLAKKNPSPPIQSRLEPAWHNIDILYDGLSWFSYSNINGVDAARSFYNGVTNHVTAARNFYAHKKKDTNEKLVSLVRREYTVAFSHDEHVTDILFKRPRGEATPLAVYWIDVVKSGAGLMV